MSNVQATEATASSTAVNTTSKAELLIRAKAAVEAGYRSMHEAAEALAVAQERHGASQADMARAIGKSEPWISRLLQWRREGYPSDSPFGPTTKAGRLAHAKDRAASGASKPRDPRKPKAIAAADDSTAAGSDTDAETSPAKGAETSEHALAELKDGIDRLVPLMDDAAKKEASDYLLKKIDEWVS
jgi:hypothetical protein